MQKTIKTTNLTMTPELSLYLDEKLQSVERLIDPNDTISMCRIELEKTTDHHQTGKVYRAEFNIQTATGMFRVESTEESIEAALDEVKDEAIKRLRRRKGKYIQKVRRGGAKVKDWLRGFSS